MNVRKIAGRVETLGQHLVEADHVTYAYIRILRQDGEIDMIERVVVGNACDSYLEPGVLGEFYVARLGIGTTIMIGLVTGGRTVLDARQLSRNRTGLIALGVGTTAVGMLSSAFVVGIPLLVMGAALLFVGAGMPTAARVREAMAA